MKIVVQVVILVGHAYSLSDSPLQITVTCYVIGCGREESLS